VAGYELHIGTHVRSRDGTKLGSIDRLIVHPDTDQEDGFLLGKGHVSRNKIVAVGNVGSTDAVGVVLKLDTHQAERLPVFIQEQILKTPGDFTYTGRLGAQATVPGLGEHWVMRAPGGDFSTVDSNSLFAPAPIGTLEAQNLDDLPPDSILLSKGTEVIGSDGRKIGHVDEDFVDSERGITEFLVKAGYLFTHDVRVPMSSVAGINHAHVRLNVTAEYTARTSRDADA